MSDVVQKAFEQVRDLIDEVCAPAKMSKEEYRDFIHETMSELEVRLEAVEGELEEESDDEEDEEEDDEESA